MHLTWGLEDQGCLHGLSNGKEAISSVHDCGGDGWGGEQWSQGLNLESDGLDTSLQYPSEDTVGSEVWEPQVQERGLRWKLQFRSHECGYA